MIKIAIVEDEAKYQELFQNYIKRYAGEKALDIDVKVFGDGLEITEGYNSDFDGILLDIKMKHQDGLDAARIIRTHDSEVPIIFITTLAQYALHGYEVGALDYILKPVEYEKFAVRFSRLIKSVKKNDEHYILLKSEEGTDRVSVNQIKYIEVNHHILDFHVAGTAGERIYQMRKSISAVEQELEGLGFVRCDQSLLVNISYISTIKKDTLLIGETVLPISRSRRKAFLSTIASNHL